VDKVDAGFANMFLENISKPQV